MKILGGIYRGKNFYMPSGIRPTQDLVRKAIFDIVGQRLEEITFLDLFAGSGALGLEAISRGAKRVLFVEKDMRCAGVIEQNIGVVNPDLKKDFNFSFFVMSTDAFVAVKELNRKREKFDIVFADPPYGVELAKKTLKTLSAHDILHPNSLVIIQHDKRERLPDAEGEIRLLKERKYGASLVSIYQKA